MLKLVFAERLPYDRNKGYRTAKTSKVFKALEACHTEKSDMVIPAGLEPATSRLGILRSILMSYGTTLSEYQSSEIGASTKQQFMTCLRVQPNIRERFDFVNICSISRVYTQGRSLTISSIKPLIVGNFGKPLRAVHISAISMQNQNQRDSTLWP